MPKSFDISSSTGRYTVEVGTGLLTRTLENNPNAIIICDRNLSSHLPATAVDPIFIEAVESNKSLEAIPGVIVALRQRNANRNTHLVVIGGGIIQDISTLAASIYMRGISWTYLPSTVLGMVDSCIGGKSSINVGGYKNLVGNFYPPRDILIDTAFINSLDAEMVVGGLYEAAKICYARSFEDFNEYLGNNPGYPLTEANAEAVILKSLTTKKWFIETDEFDNRERLLLNFGHTFGHAMEAATNFGVSHGIAVGVGMLIAINYATRRGEMDAVGIERTRQLAKHVKSMLGHGEGSVVPNPPVIPIDVVLEKFSHDKKHRSDGYRVVIPRTGGALELVSQPRSDEVHSDIALSYRETLKDIGWSFT
ncbi:3-dehydroquinate synthase family protein [Rhizobium rhizogenes]|uniref:3-dehydroquinate synthase n=1 Tax=Rhizobium rhizogenes TaxID=359 RepID=UPI0015722F08|nr:3-dehydroquinate synthase family protein [Rhizobium rhizogenes]NTF45743.1 3-dehydroquinate synthase [Rhizobium rhizogenes]